MGYIDPAAKYLNYCHAGLRRNGERGVFNCRSNIPDQTGRPMRPAVPFVFILLLAVWLTACAGKGQTSLDLMPAPEVYSDGTVDPFSHQGRDTALPYSKILYATDRRPSEEGHSYTRQRGFHLRLGLAEIKLGRHFSTWEEARRISLLKNRTDKYPLQVENVQEFGILDRSFTMYTSPELIPADPKAAARRFARQVNEKLAVSGKKEIFIYIHGYKVNFDNPLLVASELWHFLGNDGVFIAFAWPSTPKTLAYAADVETAALSAHNLRILLEYLAEETDAREINIIAYSAGTRLALGALAQLAFIHQGDTRAAVQAQRRIGNVILTASDVDRHLFGAYLYDGLMKVPRNLTVYVSQQDKALKFSRWMFRRNRLGQMWNRPVDAAVNQFVRDAPYLHLIDVTGVEGTTSGHGHAYFRQSPWISSDILMALLYDLDPEGRGLSHSAEYPVWQFPENYIQKLKLTLRKQR